MTVLNSDTPAYLPKSHLSDSRENCQQLMELYQVGDVIKDAMYLTHTSHTVSFVARCSLGVGYGTPLPHYMRSYALFF